MKTLFPSQCSRLWLLLLITSIAASQAYADLLSDLSKKLSAPSKGGDRSVPMHNDAGPARPNNPQYSQERTRSPRSSTSRNLGLPEETNIDSLDLPMLQDGSLFLSRRIYKGSLTGRNSYGSSNSIEKLFIHAASLSDVTKRLLTLAHGSDQSRKSDPVALEDIVKQTKAYREAKDDFERRDILAALRPKFESAFARIQQITHVTALIEPTRSVDYSLKDQGYVSASNDNFVRFLSAEGTYGVSFVDGRGNPWGVPRLFPFPPDKAEQIQAEAKRDQIELTVVMLLRGTFYSTSEKEKKEPDGEKAHFGSGLVIQANSIESFLVGNAPRNSLETRWKKRIGNILME